jgi:hypothetical protein
VTMVPIYFDVNVFCQVMYIALHTAVYSRWQRDIGVAWRGVAWHGVAWRGVAWRGVAWRGVVVIVVVARWEIPGYGCCCSGTLSIISMCPQFGGIAGW